MKKLILATALAMSLTSLTAVSAEAAGKKQMKGFCLPFSLQILASIVAAASKKTAPCLIPIMKKRK